MVEPRKTLRPGPLPHQQRLRNARELRKARAAASGVVTWGFSPVREVSPWRDLDWCLP